LAASKSQLLERILVNRQFSRAEVGCPAPFEPADIPQRVDKRSGSLMTTRHMFDMTGMWDLPPNDLICSFVMVQSAFPSRSTAVHTRKALSRPARPKSRD